MREIKFRGKRVDNGEWVYGYYDGCYETATINYLKNGIPYNACVIPETVGQFTNLKDKNGKEVFEGDILHAKGDGKLASINQESFFEVKWNGKNACFTFLRNNYPPSDEFDIVYDMATNMIFGICEAIGNIYENPELLEV